MYSFIHFNNIAKIIYYNYVIKTLESIGNRIYVQYTKNTAHGNYQLALYGYTLYPHVPRLKEDEEEAGQVTARQMLLYDLNNMGYKGAANGWLPNTTVFSPVARRAC